MSNKFEENPTTLDLNDGAVEGQKHIERRDSQDGISKFVKTLIERGLPANAEILDDDNGIGAYWDHTFYKSEEEIKKEDPTLSDERVRELLGKVSDIPCPLNAKEINALIEAGVKDKRTK